MPTDFDLYFDTKERKKIISIGKKYMRDFLSDGQIEYDQIYQFVLRCNKSAVGTEQFLGLSFELMCYQFFKEHNISCIRNNDWDGDYIPDFYLNVDNQEIVSDAFIVNHKKDITKFHWTIREKRRKHNHLEKPMIPFVGAFERELTEEDLQIISDRMWHFVDVGVMMSQNVVAIMIFEFDRYLQMGKIHLLKCPDPIYNIDLTPIEKAIEEKR